MKYMNKNRYFLQMFMYNKMFLKKTLVDLCMVSVFFTLVYEKLQIRRDLRTDLRTKSSKPWRINAMNSSQNYRSSEYIYIQSCKHRNFFKVICFHHSRTPDFKKLQILNHLRINHSKIFDKYG